MNRGGGFEKFLGSVAADATETGLSMLITTLSNAVVPVV
jgi:hypothetical protein